MQLSWEPLKWVSAPACGSPEVLTSILELSNTDMLHDLYNSVLLIYDVCRNAAPSSAAYLQNAEMAVPLQREEPAKRLMGALEELLLHYPSARGAPSGLLMHNEYDGRLEVRYPTLYSSASTSNVHVQTTPLIPPASSTGIAEIVYMYGVQFHVAHANVALSNLGDASDPQPCMDVLYPIIVHPNRGALRVAHGRSSQPARCIMAFQLTTFTCGGFTLAHACSHLYSDGFGAATFLKNLCSIARGTGLANPPDFSRSRRVALSPRDPPSPTAPYTFIRTRQRSAEPPRGPLAHLHYSTATRFVFPLDALEALREHASTQLPAGQSAKPCSRTQALFALLWTAFARVKLEVHGRPASEEMPLRFAMNLRGRGVPNLSANYVGNAVYLGATSATLEELCENPLSHMVAKISRVMGRLDLVEAYQSVIDDLELKFRSGLVPFIQGGLHSIVSLVSLPFYDTDCGWGSPVYVGRPSQQLSDRCIVLEHPAARAWNVLVVFALEKERACFEKCIANYIRSPNNE